MKLVDDLERVAETAVPALRGGRIGLWIAGCVLAALAIAFAVWWVFIHPGEMAANVGQANVDAGLGKATGTIATEAIPQINEANRQKVEVDVRVQKGMIDVRSAPDAAVKVGGVSDALRRNLCLHEDLYAADPDCIALHQDPTRVGAAGADAGRAAGADRR